MSYNADFVYIKEHEILPRLKANTFRYFQTEVFIWKVKEMSCEIFTIPLSDTLYYLNLELTL